MNFTSLTSEAAVAQARRPRPSDDFLDYRDLLTLGEQQRLRDATAIFDREVRPVIGAHWDAATFPFELSRADLSVSTFLWSAPRARHRRNRPARVGRLA